MKLTKISSYANAEGSIIHELAFNFALSDEDLKIVENIIKPELENTVQRSLTIEETLMACLTLGIHEGYKQCEGVPFTLRMDRNKNVA